MQYGDKPDDPLPSGQAVAELLSGGQGRGAGGENLQFRKLVCPDLEQSAWVGELVNFIEDHDGFPDRAKEVLGITQAFGDTGQIAVEVLGVRQGFGQDGLPHAPRPAEPRHRGLIPGVVEPGSPERAFSPAGGLFV